MARCHSSTLEWYCLQQQQEYDCRATMASTTSTMMYSSMPRRLSLLARCCCQWCHPTLTVLDWCYTAAAAATCRSSWWGSWCRCWWCHHTLTALDWCQATAGARVDRHIKIYSNGGSRTSLSLAKFISCVSFEGLLLVFLLELLSRRTLVIFVNSHAELVELLQTCRLPRLALHSRTCVQGRWQSRLIRVSIVLIHLQCTEQATNHKLDHNVAQ
jgi:hypothetical protein